MVTAMGLQKGEPEATTKAKGVQSIDPRDGWPDQDAYTFVQTQAALVWSIAGRQ